MKKLLIIVTILFLKLNGFAQVIGNEWIKTNQPYYKIKIVELGVYKIDSNTLAQLGVNLVGLNPNRFQIFKNGEEQACYIHGESDAIFNSDDYLIFYGTKNDGTLDTELYKNAYDQPHQYNSLFSDTSVYFLTILPNNSATLGKRFTRFNETNYNAYTPENYFINEIIEAPLEEYYRGKSELVGPGDFYYFSEYTFGESWVDVRFGLGENKIYSLNTPHLFAGGPEAILETKVFGVSDDKSNKVNHHLRLSIANDNTNYTTLKDTTYTGYIETNYYNVLSNSLIGNTTYLKFENIPDLNLSSDYNSISLIKLKYASLFDFLNYKDLLFKHKTLQNATRIYFQISNYSKSKPVLLDLKNNVISNCNLSGNTLNTLTPNFNNEQLFYIYDESDIRSINSLELVNMNYIQPNLNTEYLIISNKKIETAAIAYKNYRAQKFNTSLVYSNDLYNQFYYGYEHPLAVSHLLKYLYKNQTIKPSYLLLLGRGYQNNLIRNGFQDAYNNNLVPAIGEPSSDHMFSIGLNQSMPYAPALATGRIPAANNEEAFNYLNKLINYEKDTIFDIDWRKQVLHVSGGSGSEQLDYTNQANYNKSLISNLYYGANVTSFNKNTSGTVQTDFKPVLIKELNSGKSMMTFLGHGSLSVLDVDFGRISDMQNTNKYTFFYFNGCNIGNANDADPQGSGNIYGKDFIVAPNKGAIGWLAHSNLTLSNQLFIQMNTFYKNFSKDYYGNSIGKIIQQTLAETTVSGGLYEVSHGNQILFQGDPALRIGSPLLPDYEIKNTDVFLSDKNITALVDSFEINGIVKNLGRANNDTVFVLIEHTTSTNNLTYRYDSILLITPLYKDTFSVKLPGKGKSMIGDNTFKITLDYLNLKNEINETNNETTITKFIPGSGINTIYPTNFSIVNSDSVELVAQNNDLRTEDKEYIFEIDNSHLFNTNSPFYQTSGIIKANDLVKWKIKLSSLDTTVYYWRVKINVPETQGGIWNNASFTKILNGSYGFMQSTFEQYSNTIAMDKVLVDSIAKQISFVNSELVIGIQNKRFDHRNMGVIIPYQLNQGVGTCPGNTVVALVFEPSQVDIPYEIPNYPFNCQFIQDNKENRSRRYYPFGTETLSGRSEFKRFIDSIPSGYYVAIFSRYNSDINNWDQATLNSLKKLGAVKIPQIKSNNTAWAIISKKDAEPGYAVEDTVNNDSLGALVNMGLVGLPPATNQPQDSKILVIKKGLVTKWHTGSIVSIPFGPVSSWNKLNFNFIESDNSTNSKLNIDLLGVNVNGMDTLLFKNITVNNFDISTIDAKKFPYLKIKLNMEDSAKRTPQQFGYWQLLASPIAEAKLSPNIAFSLKNNPIEEGDSLQLEMGVENISNTNYEPTNLNIKIVNELRAVKYEKNITLDTINNNSFTIVKTKLATLGLQKNNTVQFSLNNNRKTNELTFANNFFATNFDVKNDKSNPYLEVTFDGSKIMNGEIVSATPIINITSTDNNKYIFQKDTALFNVLLRKPNSIDFDRINLNSPEIEFTPASNNSNKSTIIYRPKNLTDGEYSLRIQSMDAVGNPSGNNDFEVSFEIINKSSISNFLPYPNPATTNVRFIFTLTGSVLPDDLLIRISTISGKVVKEINKQEFGNIKFGNNISEYAWDGNDMYGDRLANGVYLYQVFTRINQKNIENYKIINNDKYFTQGVGKIYLMR